MKLRVLMFGLCFLFLGCHKDQQCIDNTESCDFQNLTVCDSTAIDLHKYTTRKEGFSYGYANAIKQVGNAGEIAWKANCIGTRFNEQDLYISFSTYSDTSWIGLEFWAYLREVILIKFKLEPGQNQKVKPESEFKKDPSIIFAHYTKYIDDVDDAKWDIDPEDDSYIIVSNYDSLTDIVSGTFDLKFVKVKDNTHSGETYANKVRFRCGSFEAKFQ